MRANVSSGCWWLAEGKQSKSSSTNNTPNLATKNKMSLNFKPTLKREGRVSKGHTEALKPSLLARNYVAECWICIFLQVIHPKLLAQAAGTQHYLDGFTTTLKGSEREKKTTTPNWLLPSCHFFRRHEQFYLCSPVSNRIIGVISCSCFSCKSVQIFIPMLS